MKIEDPLPGFESLQIAVIDASSLIYMQKAGFLEAASEHIRLHAPLCVVAEAGFADVPVVGHAPDHVQSQDRADQQLLSLGERLQVPVISEDKKILQSASRKGLPYYNALMVLNFLLFKRCIALDAFNSYRNDLLSIARYSESVIAYGEAVTERILAGYAEL